MIYIYFVNTYLVLHCAMKTNYLFGNLFFNYPQFTLAPIMTMLDR